MVALVNQSPDKKSVTSAFSQFCHRTTNETQEIAHKLLGEKFIEQIDVLRETTKNVLNTEFAEDVSHQHQNLRKQKFIRLYKKKSGIFHQKIKFLKK